MTKPYLQPVAPHTVNGTVPLWPRGGVVTQRTANSLAVVSPRFVLCLLVLFCLKNFVFEFVTS
jgi:hypothetical protein